MIRQQAWNSSDNIQKLSPNFSWDGFLHAISGQLWHFWFYSINICNTMVCQCSFVDPHFQPVGFHNKFLESVKIYEPCIIVIGVFGSFWRHALNSNRDRLNRTEADREHRKENKKSLPKSSRVSITSQALLSLHFMFCRLEAAMLCTLPESLSLEQNSTICKT